MIQEDGGLRGTDMNDSLPPHLMVSLSGPIDVAASLEPFRRNGDDFLDRWDGVHLVRTLEVEDRRVPYLCSNEGTVLAPALRLTLEDPAAVPAVERAVASTFVAPPPEYPELVHSDPVVGRLDALFPGIRPVLQFDLLGALVRSISSQQVNLKWAVTTRRRLAEAFGDRYQVDGHFVYALNADRLAGATVEQIRALQFTTRKAEYLIGVAEAVAAGRLSMPALVDLPDAEVISTLTALRGIGLWTAEWILARSLGRPRVVAGDLGVRKAVGLAYLGTPLPSEAQVRELTAHWGPSAGTAQQLLLYALARGALEG